MEFSFLLREIRIKKSITQKKLAELLLVPRTVISMYETGKRIPTKSRYKQICKILDVSEIDLPYTSYLKVDLKDEIKLLKEENQKLKKEIDQCPMCKIRRRLESEDDKSKK